jgi:hypothetical protein
VPLLLLGPPFFPDYSFWSTTLLTGMTGISLHMQWPLTKIIIIFLIFFVAGELVNFIDFIVFQLMSRKTSMNT